MFVEWIQRASRTKRVGRALQTYLWWGVLVRGLLLLALAALLLAEGNFLAEWLLASRLVPSSADVEEYTAISYVALMVWLGIGVYLRWRIVRTMKTAPEPTSDEGEMQSGGASIAGSDSPKNVRRSADDGRSSTGSGV